MKYRRLHQDELEELEQDFVRFLSAQSILGEDWQQMKNAKPEQAEALIGQFSDIVFEKVLHNIEYLELKSPKDLKVFHCTADRMYLLGLFVEGDSSFDFTQNQNPGEMLEQIRRSGASLKLYKAEKAYSKERNRELFEMMEQGCKISKGELFNTLKSLF